MKPLSIPSSLQDLFAAAQKARENAYSPYSTHKVGAALRTEKGEIFSGCNVENSSYGATICAERAAIHNAVSSAGKIRVTEILVMTDASPPWPPCGVCRQVLAEFASDALIHATNLSGELKTMKLSELLPNAFTPQHLRR